MKSAVINASPWIALSSCGKIELLQKLYDKIIMPIIVKEEILAGGNSQIGITELEKASWLQIEKIKDYGGDGTQKDAVLIAESINESTGPLPENPTKKNNGNSTANVNLTRGWSTQGNLSADLVKFSSRPNNDVSISVYKLKGSARVKNLNFSGLNYGIMAIDNIQPIDDNPQITITFPVH